MHFRQYDLGCLSLFSYLVGDESTGRAVVVDPQRDIGQYLADAEAQGLHIERVIETHFHADFLSGHLELAAATGAVISYGEGARADFDVDELADGRRLPLGDVTLEVRATPGHTPESISVVVREHPDGPPWGVLTGDTLFIGDVGRPDLLASSGWTSEQLARRLYRSLHDKLLTLPDATRVFPAHGAGSSCGKNLANAAESTIGAERAANYALQPMSEDEFVEAVLDEQSVAPPYFAFAADANRRERALLAEHEAPEPLSLDTVLRLRREGALVVDARSPEDFAAGHLESSVNVGLDGRFAEFAGDVAAPGQPIVLVVPEARAVEAKVRLARIGFDDVRGAVTDIDAVLAQHPELARVAPQVSPGALAAALAEGAGLQLVDVRNPGELADGVVPGARPVPLPALQERLGELEPGMPTVVYCASGNRSSIAASVLRAHGFARVTALEGGIGAWQAEGRPLEAPAAVGSPGGTA